MLRFKDVPGPSKVMVGRQVDAPYPGNALVLNPCYFWSLNFEPILDWCKGEGLDFSHAECVIRTKNSDTYPRTEQLIIMRLIWFATDEDEMYFVLRWPDALRISLTEWT